MTTLTEFLLACIAEDEELARDQLRAYQHVFGIPHYFRIDHSIVGLTPRTALAECEAKRRIIASYVQMVSPDDGPAPHKETDQHGFVDADGKYHSGQIGDEYSDGYFVAIREACYALALPYADRPGFREEWRLEPSDS